MASSAMTVHQRLTVPRAQAYEQLFGAKPTQVFPYYRFAAADTPCVIDVFVYPLEVADVEGPVLAAVTNGMSDFRMVDKEREEFVPRRELIQYLRVCKEVYARRLHDCAWLPHVDKFAIDVHDTIAWPDAVEKDLQDAFFLLPIWSPHAGFSVELDGDNMSLLWHIPITRKERTYKHKQGVNALLDRMDQVKLPWLFDPANRPDMLPPSP
jgi:hypothetical protein